MPAGVRPCLGDRAGLAGLVVEHLTDDDGRREPGRTRECEPEFVWQYRKQEPGEFEVAVGKTDATGGCGAPF